MTSRERIAAALGGRDHDHVPFCPFLAYVWEHFPEKVREAGQPAFHARVGADPLWRGAPCPVRAIPPEMESRSYPEGDRHVGETVTPVGTLRSAQQHSPGGGTYFLVEHPLKTEEDFKVQLWIEEHTRLEFDSQPVADHLNGAGSEGLSLGMLIPRCKSAFQSMIEHLVGTEELVYALADFPETVEALWATMVANDLRAAQMAAEAEYDYFLTWEDSGTQNYSPGMYEKYIGSEIGRWCDILAGGGKRYIQHACGNLRGILAPMKAHRAYGVESLSAPPTGDVSLREARGIVGGDFAIIGGIEPTQFLHLSLDALGPYVEQMIADGSGGPFVLANSDSCPPGVTEAKFKRAADVARATRPGTTTEGKETAEEERGRDCPRNDTESHGRVTQRAERHEQKKAPGP